MIEIARSFTVRADYDKDSPCWQDREVLQWALDVESSAEELVPLSAEIARTRKDVIYLKCPAHTDYLKNTFIFRSPIDLDFDIDIDDDIVKVFCENLPQSIFQNIIDLRFVDHDNAGKSQHPIIGIDFLNIFQCREEMTVSVMPAFLHVNDFTDKTMIIPGQYDVSRWTRPIELVFELKKSKSKIAIKKGDALCYFKFLSDQQLKIKKSPCPYRDMEICSNLVAAERFKPLKYRYESLKKINNG